MNGTKYLIFISYPNVKDIWIQVPCKPKSGTKYCLIDRSDKQCLTSDWSHISNFLLVTECQREEYYCLYESGDKQCRTIYPFKSIEEWDKVLPTGEQYKQIRTNGLSRIYSKKQFSFTDKSKNLIEHRANAVMRERQGPSKSKIGNVWRIIETVGLIYPAKSTWSVRCPHGADAIIKKTNPRDGVCPMIQRMSN